MDYLSNEDFDDGNKKKREKKFILTQQIKNTEGEEKRMECFCVFFVYFQSAILTYFFAGKDDG